MQLSELAESWVPGTTPRRTEGHPQHTFSSLPPRELFFLLGICALSQLDCYHFFSHPTRLLSTYHWGDTGLGPGNKISGAQAHRATRRVITVCTGWGLPPAVKGHKAKRS